jgi:hypothetical protein
MTKKIPTFNEFVNEQKQLGENKANGENSNMIKGLSKFDEFITEQKQLSENKANENSEVVVHFENPQKSETMSLTDKEGNKYDLYELKKEVSELPTDIFIGFKK